LALHAESRRADDIPGKVNRIWEEANALAGEPFALDTPVTSLSGGQSRALMIADTAVLSRSPVVLIDEIENAGIDRRKALEVLVGQDKIVLMATHDPILALMGDRRVVVAGGAMRAVVEPSAAERANLVELRALDARLMELRGRLRRGERLDVI
jgi:ABC-type lipoprotein export system ATPase subunit